ncbi:hypothetical protein MHYP_G00004210 [Metynnis hypsauchen]
MLLFAHFILIVLVGGVYSIDPLETEKQVSVGERVSLSCRYSTSNVYLYWYRQYPSSKPDFLLYMRETGSVRGSPPPGFSAKVLFSHSAKSTETVVDKFEFILLLPPQKVFLVHLTNVL